MMKVVSACCVDACGVGAGAGGGVGAGAVMMS